MSGVTVILSSPQSLPRRPISLDDTIFEGNSSRSHITLAFSNRISLRALALASIATTLRASFTTMSDENSPDSSDGYTSPPDTGLYDTDNEIECSECGKTDYFQHDGNPDNALCKHCGHTFCSECKEA
ncbi:hypothetical protein F5Y00DRAFT_267148 [Daldinia vernicosa]|uniref:uncharacterized protein n=1 Tax=Daldinia vernicosa TaxID=114800 RepID=UPI0020087288|nr:uncharacterized protein F5Y00DRAFT_267148 [Daldinia vernicosa]KAI0843855.1 hypothetical protein F5Y00DRAFT_267148 [Daldinia vernicosa]